MPKDNVCSIKVNNLALKLGSICDDCRNGIIQEIMNKPSKRIIVKCLITSDTYDSDNYLTQCNAYFSRYAKRTKNIKAGT